MVNDPRAQTGSGIRPVNQPVPVEVGADADGKPQVVAGTPVSSILDDWRLNREWWRPKPVVRFYYDVLLADGSHVTIFFDSVSKDWFRQRYA